MGYDETELGSAIEVRCIIEPKVSSSPEDLKELGKILSLLQYIQLPAAGLCVSDLDEDVGQLLAGEFPLPISLQYTTRVMDQIRAIGPEKLDQMFRDSGEDELAETLQTTSPRDLQRKLSTFLKESMGADYSQRILGFTVSGHSSGEEVCATDEDEVRILDALHQAIPENLVEDVRVQWINPAGGPGTRQRVISWNGAEFDGEDDDCC